jgi:dienelactone hydrolase
MADVVLFHSALGLTEGVHAFAERLRAAGHTVTTPDLFEGRTFGSIEEGVAHAESIGMPAIAQRGAAAVAGLPDRLVTAGFSLGVLPAQLVAQTRAGARGALLYSSAVPASFFSPAWPAGVGLQLHLVEGDPWAEEDLPAAEELARTVDGAELFLYPGTGHLVCEQGGPDYDENVCAQIVERSLAFLDRVG